MQKKIEDQLNKEAAEQKAQLREEQDLILMCQHRARETNENNATCELKNLEIAISNRYSLSIKQFIFSSFPSISFVHISFLSINTSLFLS